MSKKDLNQFALRFPQSEIPHWAEQYSDSNDDLVETEVGPRIRAQGYCGREDFIKLCHWKTPRIRPRCAGNTAEFIQAVTETALSTPNERLRIEVLTLLSGVGWPMASVILHFGHREPYPILDFRALRSLGIDTPPTSYKFDFWFTYTQTCRQLAAACQVSMRQLDRALWAYSKEKQ